MSQYYMNVVDVIDLTMLTYVIHILSYSVYIARLYNTVTLIKHQHKCKQY